jgi:hypothetical protein
MMSSFVAAPKDGIALRASSAGWGVDCCIAETVSVALSGLLSYPTSSRMLGNISNLREFGWHGRYPTWRMGCSMF